MEFKTLLKKSTEKVENSFNVEALQNEWKGSSLKQKAMMLAFMGTLTSNLMAQEAADEMESLWNDEILPILNVVLGIACGIAIVVLGIQFFRGKKEALQQLGYIVAGAVVIRVLFGLLSGIIDGGMFSVSN